MIVRSDDSIEAPSMHEDRAATAVAQSPIVDLLIVRGMDDLLLCQATSTGVCGLDPADLVTDLVVDTGLE